MTMHTEMARDFDGEALRQIAVLADAHARTLRRYMSDQPIREQPAARSAIWKFESMAASCRRIIDLQREPVYADSPLSGR